MALKLRKSGEKGSDVVFPLNLYVRNITIFSSNLLFIWVCMEIFHAFRSAFVLYFFVFLLLDMKMLNKLYVFLSTACVSVPLLITVFIPS